MPPRQPKRGRLWLNEGSCVRLRPERPNHVWGHDFVEDRTREGRKFRMLCVVGGFTREALRIRVARRLSSPGAIDVLSDLFVARGAPVFVRSDNGGEFTAAAVQDWISKTGAGQGADLLEPRVWDGLSERVIVASYSASRSLRTAAI